MLTIIGCGNPNRSDDGVGVVVARELMARFADERRPGVQIFDAGTDGMGVMFKARGSDALVIIDASRTGAEPGSVYEVPGQELEGEPNQSLNLHDFRWDHALFAGRKIFKRDFPDDVTVFLIEAQSLDLGLELSEPARAGADKVVETLTARVRAYDA
ncbi:MAG: hydrogenase maturation protease [Myxococcota bacterium]